MSGIMRRDVAKEAGVSESVVSYVINNTARENRISDSTIVRVSEVAKRLGYRPNVFGKGLRTNRSGMVAFVGSDITDSNTAQIIKALGESLRKSGYGLMLTDLAGRQAVEQADLRTMEMGFADAFLLHVPPDPLLALCRDGRLFHKPACVMGRQLEGDLSFVEVDNELGAELAMRHLREAGVRRPAILADDECFEYSRARLRGARRVLPEFAEGPAPMQTFSPAEGDAFEAGLAAVEAWRRQPDFPDGIFAMGDVQAIGVLYGLTRRGIRCPQDTKVVGFDGIPFARYASPPLTTVEQPYAELASNAVRILEAQMADPTRAREGRLFAPRLVARESTGFSVERGGGG